ncbi:MAG: molybdopterin molybdotransferase MoeA [Burkholderiaceae bacterium]
MLTLDAFLDLLAAQAVALPSIERLPLQQAFGRILAHDLNASVAVPPQACSAMDGYAVRCADWVDEKASSIVVPISQRIPAGCVPQVLQAGTCARIFTGAIVPLGADAVVAQENVDISEQGACFSTRPVAGQFIRDAGGDIAAGATVLHSGQRLGAVQLGIAASLGVATVEVYRRPRVGLFFTGDELQAPGIPLAAGKIYNTNRGLWQGLLQTLPVEIIDLGDVADDLSVCRAALQAAAECDVALGSGGVSVGEADHMQAALMAEGCVAAWKLAIKPGKPLLFGQVGRAWFFGLPGNPVSSFVTFRLLVQPFLQRCAGQRSPLIDWRTQLLTGRAAFERAASGDARLEFARARFNDGQIVLYAKQDSNLLSSLAWADGLALLPAGEAITRGDKLSFLPLSL